MSRLQIEISREYTTLCRVQELFLDLATGLSVENICYVSNLRPPVVSLIS
jgi:hypothetical protein